MNSLSGIDGVRFDGLLADGQAGIGVGSAGDLNRDGLPDFVICADSGGYAMVVYGNKPPLVVGGPAMLGAIAEDSQQGYFVLIAVNAFYSDQQSQGGIAVTSSPVPTANGRWQYTIDNGASDVDVPTGLSNSNALVLTFVDAIRFLPAADFNGTSSVLSIRMWDGTDGYSHGTGRNITGSIGSFGGFSTGQLSVLQPVLAINDPPNHGDHTRTEPGVQRRLRMTLPWRHGRPVPPVRDRGPAATSSPGAPCAPLPRRFAVAGRARSTTLESPNQFRA